MSSNTFLGRAFRGDVDPGDLLGLNPTNQEIKANKAERKQRKAQIDFEKNNPILKKLGGSIDAPTQQVGKIARVNLFGGTIRALKQKKGNDKSSKQSKGLAEMLQSERKRRMSRVKVGDVI